MELGSLSLDCDGAQLTIITWRLVVNELFLFLFFFCSLDSQLAKVDGGLTHLYSSSHTCKNGKVKRKTFHSILCASLQVPSIFLHFLSLSGNQNNNS